MTTCAFMKMSEGQRRQYLAAASAIQVRKHWRLCPWRDELVPYFVPVIRGVEITSDKPGHRGWSKSDRARRDGFRIIQRSRRLAA